MLELRVDNVAYRALWAASRSQARQFVSHGHITVNGKRVTIASYRLRVGDVVALKESARDIITIRQNLDTIDRAIPGWLEVTDSGLGVIVRALPEREQIDTQVREQLIVELYSK
jgi:small subunit ribosomal protein S4